MDGLMDCCILYGLIDWLVDVGFVCHTCTWIDTAVLLFECGDSNQ